MITAVFPAQATGLLISVRLNDSSAHSPVALSLLFQPGEQLSKHSPDRVLFRFTVFKICDWAEW